MKDPADDVTLDLPIIDAEMLASVASPPLNPPMMMGARQLANIDLKEVALSRFGEWRPQALALVRKYDGVAFDCKTTKGMADAVAARMEVREPRYAAQRVAKASKSELATVSKAIGAEEAAVIEMLAKTEEHIDRQIRAEEERKAAEKADRERAEQARVAGHMAGLAVIRKYLTAAQGLPSARIEAGVEALRQMKFGDAQEEFLAEFEATRSETLTAMADLYGITKAQEDKDQEREAARAELAAAQHKLENERRQLEVERSIMLAKIAELEADKKRRDDALEKARNEAIRAEQAIREKAMSEAARIEAEKTRALNEQAIAAATHPHAMAAVLNPPADKPVFVPQPTPVLARPKITLSIISQRLGFLVTQAFLHDLGHDPAEKVKTSVLYAEEDFVPICKALINHIAKVEEEHV